MEIVWTLIYSKQNGFKFSIIVESVCNPWILAKLKTILVHYIFSGEQRQEQVTIEQIAFGYSYFLYIFIQ